MFDWLYECVEGANKSGEGCGYPNLLVLFVPGALAFLWAYLRWNRNLRRGTATPFFTPLVSAVIVGSLTLAAAAAVVGLTMR